MASGACATVWDPDAADPPHRTRQLGQGPRRLDGVRASLERDPLLVVPTAADVERYRRELAEDGLVIGARVLTFDGLLGEIARRAAVAGRPLGDVSRERVVASVVARADLRVMAASAATPGFARAAQRFFAELEVARVDPGRLAGALRAWRAATAAAPPTARRSPGCTARTARRSTGSAARTASCGRSARSTPSGSARRAGGATPVFFYGFDDLTPLELDAVDALGKRVGADVWVSLTFERGRAAFAGRARTVAELEPLADRRLEMEPEDRYYAPSARSALHAARAAAVRGARRDRGRPGAGRPGERSGRAPAGRRRARRGRARAAEVLDLLRGGVRAEEIAVVARSLDEMGPLLERVLTDFGVPFALRRRVMLAHTACGAAVLALLRCAALDATAADLVAYLRAPGVLSSRTRRTRSSSRCAAAAWPPPPTPCAAWCREEDEPPGLRRVRAAAQQGAGALCDVLGAELAGMLAGVAAAAPGRVLDPGGRAEAQAVAAGRAALDELAALSREAPPLAPKPADLAAQLGGVAAWRGEEPGPGLVTVCDPFALRARRVRALVLCGLQEGAFPRPATPEPFLADAERRELATASGRPPAPSRGRPRRRALPLLRHGRRALRSGSCSPRAPPTTTATPPCPSFFLDDVRDVLGELPRRHRPLGSVLWPGGAPTARAAARAEAAPAPPAGRCPSRR